MSTTTTTLSTSAMPKLAVASSSAHGYLDRALKSLSSLGVIKPAESETAPIIALASELQVLDEAKALIVARTLSHNATFNEAVRSRVADTAFADRHKEVNTLWDSILEDMSTMTKRIEEDRNGLKDKVGFWMMRLSRGTVHKRFEKLREQYLAVSADTKRALDHEATILASYSEYRLAVKESEIAAAQMLKIAEARLEEAKAALAAAQSTVEATTELEAKHRAQLARDEKQRVFEAEDRRYSIVKQLSEALTTEYNTSDVIMADLAQTRNVKDAVYRSGVLFYPTVNSILSGLSANMTSKQNLVEASRTQEHMVDGVNRGLQQLASSGRQIKLDAVKVAHGPKVKAEAVKALMESIIQYRTEEVRLIEEQRKLATTEAAMIADVVEKGREQFARIATAAAQPINVTNSATPSV